MYLTHLFIQHFSASIKSSVWNMQHILEFFYAAPKMYLKLSLLPLFLIIFFNSLLSNAQDERSNDGPGSYCMVPGYEPPYLEPYQTLQGSNWYLVEFCGKRCYVDSEC